MRTPITLVAFSLCCSLLASGALADVYKRTNPDGSVEFSDVPGSVKSEPIKLNPSSTYSPPPLPPATPSPGAKKAMTDYESVAITTPANDATVRDNAGNISVSVTSKPALQPGHLYILMMDGKKIGEGPNGQFQVTNVDRGSHTFTAQIVDKSKQAIANSPSVTVHLQRISVIHR